MCTTYLRVYLIEKEPLNSNVPLKALSRAEIQSIDLQAKNKS